MPLGGVTAGLLATDSDAARHLSNSQDRLDKSRKLSDFGAASLIGAAGGLYLWGKTTREEHKREAGLLSGEALIDGVAFAQAIKWATGRERPREDHARGSFGQGGSSFPSDHALAAWSAASVMAHEYPGPLTKLFAYGLATAVTASRVTAKEHFPSDALLGGAMGWLVGQHVYRSRHNPELGGGSWDTPSESSYAESPPKLANRGSPYVPLDSWVYPALERLAALGYVHTAFLGMRPWARLECARLIREAEEQIDANQKDAPKEVARLTRALEQEFMGELGAGGAAGLELTSLYMQVTGIVGSPLTDGYHFGQTIVNDNGRPYQEGANIAGGVTAQAFAGPFAGYLRGEFQHAGSAPPLPASARTFISHADDVPLPPALATPGVDRFDVVEGYVGATFENWEISAGKQSIWWSPASGNSLIYSDNAEPLAMIRINRISPLKLPSVLGLLGPIRVEFWMGQQHGATFLDTPAGLVGQWTQTLHPQPIIEGQKFSFKPTPNLEFGFDRTTIYGGPSFPLTAHKILRSLIATENERAGAPNKPGDRQAGFDLTYRVPGLRDWVTFYAESFTDDQFIPVAYFDRAANSAGLYFVRLPKLPRWDLRIEGVYTDNPIASGRGNLCCGFYYSNATWRYGQRNAGNLFTSWVGRDGQGFQGWLTYWQSPRSFLRIEYRHQKVSHQFVPYGGTVTDGGVKADWWLRPGLSLTSSLQCELWKFPVLASGPYTNVTSAVQLTYWPRWRMR